MRVVEQSSTSTSVLQEAKNAGYAQQLLCVSAHMRATTECTYINFIAETRVNKGLSEQNRFALNKTVDPLK